MILLTNATEKTFNKYFDIWYNQGSKFLPIQKELSYWCYNREGMLIEHFNLLKEKKVNYIDNNVGRKYFFILDKDVNENLLRFSKFILLPASTIITIETDINCILIKKLDVENLLEKYNQPEIIISDNVKIYNEGVAKEVLNDCRNIVTKNKFDININYESILNQHIEDNYDCEKIKLCQTINDLDTKINEDTYFIQSENIEVLKYYSK